MENVAFLFSAISAQSLKQQTKKKKADEQIDKESADFEQLPDSSQVASSTSQEWVTNNGQPKIMLICDILDCIDQAKRRSM